MLEVVEEAVVVEDIEVVEDAVPQEVCCWASLLTMSPCTALPRGAEWAIARTASP